ncbi:hypothetical protein BCD48_15670 [Pseudofrankia sp. BMG5.36]|nr:hypothetical protein BCD48_15670 [Pseudofrankia sp. BMG5.36]
MPISTGAPEAADAVPLEAEEPFPDEPQAAMVTAAVTTMASAPARRPRVRRDHGPRVPLPIGDRRTGPRHRPRRLLASTLLP